MNTQIISFSDMVLIKGGLHKWGGNLIAHRSVGVSVGCCAVVVLWVPKANFHFGLNVDLDQYGYEMQQFYSQK